MYKKKWQKPKLVVLVRDINKESVLDLCKWGGEVGSGPSSSEDYCKKGAPVCSLCSGSAES